MVIYFLLVEMILAMAKASPTLHLCPVLTHVLVWTQLAPAVWVIPLTVRTAMRPGGGWGEGHRHHLPNAFGALLAAPALQT